MQPRTADYVASSRSSIGGCTLVAHKCEDEIALESSIPMSNSESTRFAVQNAGEVSAILERPRKAESLLVLAHGAGAGMNHPFMQSLASELAEAKVATFRFQFPYMEQRRKIPDRPAVLTAAIAAAIRFASEA